jgi:hypothetical protein
VIEYEYFAGSILLIIVVIAAIPLERTRAMPDQERQEYNQKSEQELEGAAGPSRRNEFKSASRMAILKSPSHTRPAARW